MRMFTLMLSVVVPSLFAFAPARAPAQEMSPEEIIRSAVRAGPSSISDDAEVRDWSMNEIRPGTNGWVCLPDRADTEGDDPWCIDEPWLDFLEAYVNGVEPGYTEIGFAYMLIGDAPVSNSDPFATDPTEPADWVTDLGAHVMVLVPDRSQLAGLSTDHLNGGPWVMWPDTPYAHLMIPVASR